MVGPLVAALERTARRHSGSLALTWRGVAWSYRDLLTAVQGVSAALGACRLRHGSRIALLMRNSPQYAALYYGILQGGWVAVPLNAQERSHVLARQIEHCGATLLIGDPAHHEWPAVCREVGHAVPAIAVELAESGDAVAKLVADLGAAAPNAMPRPDPTAAPADLALIIYTSGTTGRPKGVMLSQHNLHANATAIVRYLRLHADDRGLCVLPFHFSYGTSVLNSHLVAGAHLVLEDNLAYPHVTLQRLQDEAVTGFAGVPSTFALLLGGRCRIQDFDLTSLRYVTQAGGAMAGRLLERLRACLPHVDIFVMYGQTEATARLTYLPAERLADKAGSVGVPIDGVKIDIRQDGRPVPPGEVGEIWACGPGVMLGYWRDAAATAEVLREGWLRTGDLGHRDRDGYLYVHGRAVDMIKVGAFRISPAEIEEVIAAMDGVEEAAVTGMADEMLGQVIKAVVVPKCHTRLDATAVKAHCRARLAAYKVPKVVQFAQSLPRTSSGKVQRNQLA